MAFPPKKDDSQDPVAKRKASQRAEAEDVVKGGGGGSKPPSSGPPMGGSQPPQDMSAIPNELDTGQANAGATMTCPNCGCAYDLVPSVAAPPPTEPIQSMPTPSQPPY